MSEKANIRGVFWGDSPERVKAVESEKPKPWSFKREGFGRKEDTYGDWIAYEGIVLEKNCWKRYFFEENRLFEIDHDFSPMKPDEARDLYTNLHRVYEGIYDDPFLPVLEGYYPPHMDIRDESITRCITHYSDEFVNGETVIDLCLKKRRPIDTGGLMIVEVRMWKNGFGTFSNPYYRNPIIDQDRKRERLIKEAREQM